MTVFTFINISSLSIFMKFWFHISDILHFIDKKGEGIFTFRALTEKPF